MLRRYFWGAGADEPLIQDEGGALNCTGTRFLLANHQSSVIAAGNCAGNRLAANRYDEYGIPQAGNWGRFQYTGQAWLPELGMYYYKARLYSATLGRFLQTDPIGYDDQVNLYAYVGNDPVNRLDSSGLCGRDNKPDEPQEVCGSPSNSAPLDNAPPGGDRAQPRPQEPQNDSFAAKPVDYCGAAGSEGIPEGMVATSFQGPCRKHDDCYGTLGKTQEQCDLGLGRDILNECKRTGGWLCALSSYIYYRALVGIPGVISPGKAAYDNAQRATRLRLMPGGRP